MSWQFTITLDNEQVSDILRDIAIQKLSEKFGFPNLEMIDGVLTCTFDGKSIEGMVARVKGAPLSKKKRGGGGT